MTAAPSPEPEPPSDSGQRLLREGLGKLDAGDSAGWRQLLHQHPEHAATLQRRIDSLHRHGLLPQAPLPASVGPYQLGARIGQGGMGIVLHGRRNHSEQVVEDAAVKLVHPELLAAASSRARFQREVEAIARLDHPGIVKVLAIGIADDPPWYAMELIDGVSMFALLENQSARTTSSTGQAAVPPQQQQQPQWWRLILRTLADLLDAVDHAHARGVLHRDIKPGNILIDARGRVVLIDFGLARVADLTTLTGSGAEPPGSLPYMAPELLQADSQPSMASDIYAVAIVLYQALTGQLPFQGATSVALRQAILRGLTDPLTRHDQDLPAAVEVVWQTASAPEPERRYRTAAAFAADLRAILAGQPPAARPPGLLLRSKRALKRRPLLAITLAASLLFAVLLPSAVAYSKAVDMERMQRLLDLQQATQLRNRLAQLWPARPEVVAGDDGLDAWLELATDLLSRRPRHRQDLVAVRRSGEPIRSESELSHRGTRLLRQIEQLQQNLARAEGERAAGWEDWRSELLEHLHPLQQQLQEVESYRFRDPDHGRLHRQLAELVLGLDQLAAQLPAARQRRELAMRLAHQSAAAEAAWQATCKLLADADATPAYGGLAIEAQFGLLPLGPDPRTGLLEFAHLASGEAPTRQPDGRLELAAQHGLVLVLLPGGKVRIGADHDTGQPHHDAAAAVLDTPSVTVELAPFFLAKHEVTQAQWVRQRGHNNSARKPGQVLQDGSVVGWLHPAAPLELGEAERIAGQWGLQLPTSAQWEYAARGGTATHFWTGDAPASLDGAENLADERLDFLAWTGQPARGHLQPADQWLFDAPVGSFRPNPFGLYDMLGNVPEWCGDAVRPYAEGLRDGDGRSASADSGTVRGGGFNSLPEQFRTTQRGDVPRGSLAAGLRPAMALEGNWRRLPKR